MAVESKSFPVGATPLPAVTIRLRTAGIQDTYRRQFTWAQVIIAFLFIESAVWAARLSVRSRWALATGAIVLVFALVDRPSLRRLGLGLPNAMGTSLMLGVGLTGAVFMLFMTRWAGGAVPANPLFPNMHMAWQYMIWALVQQLFFAAVHLPNMVLTTFTLIAGLFFCEMFRRYRSIYLLGIVHAVLGLTLSATIPASLLYHLRVGIGFLR